MCWSLGPAVLDDPNIVRAEPNVEPGGGGWSVIVEFGDDRFVAEVAEPYVSSSVAILVDDVVVSAPMINPGITGREIQISGAFTETEARALAASLGRDPIEIDFDVVQVVVREAPR
jgi:preprotein translocase subunit SecD